MLRHESYSPTPRGAGRESGPQEARQSEHFAAARTKSKLSPFAPLFRPLRLATSSTPAKTSQPAVVHNTPQSVSLLTLPDELIEDILVCHICTEENPFARQDNRHKLMRVCKRLHAIAGAIDKGIYALKLAPSKRATSKLYGRLLSSRALAGRVSEIAVEVVIHSSRKNEYDMAPEKLLKLFARLRNLHIMHILAPGHRMHPILTIRLEQNSIILQIYPKGVGRVSNAQSCAKIGLVISVIAALFSGASELAVFDCASPLLLELMAGVPSTIRAMSLGKRPIYAIEHMHCHSLNIELEGALTSRSDLFNIALLDVCQSLKTQFLTLGGSCPIHPGPHPDLEDEILHSLEAMSVEELTVFCEHIEVAIRWFARLVCLRQLRLGTVRMMAPTGEAYDGDQLAIQIAVFVSRLPVSVQQLEMSPLGDKLHTSIIERECKARHTTILWK